MIHKSPVTLLIDGRDTRHRTATLTPLVDATAGHTVHIVSIDDDVATWWGIPRPVSVIGGLVRVRGRWSPTAYRDRNHLLNGGGLVYYLPYAATRAHGVRALLRWWWEVAYRTREGADPRDLDPWQESAAFRRRLVT